MAATLCTCCRYLRRPSFLLGHDQFFKKRLEYCSRSFWHLSDALNVKGRSTSGTHLETSFSINSNRNQSVNNRNFLPIASILPLEVMPFSVVQGGKFVVYLLHRFQPCKTLVLVRTKVLASELSRQIREEYGIQSVAAVSERDKQNFFLLQNGEVDVLVTTDSSIKALGIPLVDLIIQVQTPIDGDESSILSTLQTSNFKDHNGRMILLYTKDNLEFLRKMQLSVEIIKLEPPSFYTINKGYDQVPALRRTVQNLPAKPGHSFEDNALIYGKKPKSVVYRPVVAVSVKESQRLPLNDRVRLYVRGGSGGQGCPRFGGLGGDGGDVILECHRTANFAHFAMKENRRLNAEHGGNYSKKRRKTKGYRGSDLIVPVPLGTTVTTDDNRFIGDLNSIGSRLLVSKGGRGGCPITDGWSGELGQRHMIRLELKLIADVGLVGFPNAGKSTLLGAISRVNPKIGNYAFTTIRPMIGTVNYTDYTQVSMADLPGLIEGAHLNRGMGHKFLKHVERTKGLALVADIDGFQLKDSTPHRNAFETVCLLIKELELFQEQLSSRSKILIVSKMDNDGAQEMFAELLDEIEELKRPGRLFSILDKMEMDEPSQNALRRNKDYLRRLRGLGAVNFQDVIPVSAVMGHGLDRLKGSVKYLVQDWGSDKGTINADGSNNPADFGGI